MCASEGVSGMIDFFLLFFFGLLLPKGRGIKACMLLYILFQGLQRCSRRWLVQRIQPWGHSRLGTLLKLLRRSQVVGLPLHSTLDHGNCDKIRMGYLASIMGQGYHS